MIATETLTADLSTEDAYLVSQAEAVMHHKESLAISTPTLQNDSSHSHPSLLPSISNSQANVPFPVRDSDITTYRRRRGKGFKPVSLQTSGTNTGRSDDRTSQSYMSIRPREIEEEYEMCFVPKDIRLKGLEDIYATHFVIPRPQLTPPSAVRKSYGSPRGRRSRDAKQGSKEQTTREVRVPSEPPVSSPFPILMQRPMLNSKLLPLERKHRHFSSKPASKPVTTNAEVRFSPYNIRFMQPYIKYFKLPVDVDLKPVRNPPALVGRKTERKEVQGQVKKALKIVNSAM